MGPARGMAIGYAVILGGVTAIGYVPALQAGDGRLFGVFRLTWYNDVLHVASALWAAGAALWSEAAAVLFLQVFGALYLADGLMGLAIGSGYLDLGILVRGIVPLPLGFKLAANGPHILLGSLALAAGLAWRHDGQP